MSTTILIADTCDTTRELLKRVLANRFTLIIVESPLQALSVMLEKRIPSLVLMGLDESRDKDGHSLFTAIRQQAADITLIALGERHEEIKALEAVNAGASGYMIKPLNPHQILSLAEKTIFSQCRANAPGLNLDNRT